MWSQTREIPYISDAVLYTYIFTWAKRRVWGEKKCQFLSIRMSCAKRAPAYPLATGLCRCLFCIWYNNWLRSRALQAHSPRLHNAPRAPNVDFRSTTAPTRRQRATLFERVVNKTTSPWHKIDVTVTTDNNRGSTSLQGNGSGSLLVAFCLKYDSKTVNPVCTCVRGGALWWSVRQVDPHQACFV